MKKVLCSFLFILFFVWAVLSFARVGYSMIIGTKDAKQWFFGNAYTNDLALYGDVYLIFRKLQQIDNTSKEVYLLAKDGKPYYYGRYVLYPEKLYWQTSFDKNKFKKHDETIIIYHPQDFPDLSLYKTTKHRITEIRDAKNTIVAYIYKRL